LVTALLEQLVAQAYQFCLFDPEGDYETFPGAIMLGSAQKEPEVKEIVQLLEKSEQSAIINLLGRAIEDRPGFLQKVLPALQEIQTCLGHPHWLILDEAHHLLPPTWDPTTLQRIGEQFSTLFVTTHPNHISKQTLESINVIIGVGSSALAILREVSQAIGQPLPGTVPSTLNQDEGLVWFRHTQQAPLRVQLVQPKQLSQRHRRKYAEGRIGENVSFYFCGPEGKLHLRAQNLALFRQIAQGVDEQTWLFHLHQGDYSRWFREVIKDADLAAETEEIEKNENLSASESRAKVEAAIERRYTQSA
jgi:hypothetical protein